MPKIPAKMTPRDRRVLDRVNQSKRKPFTELKDFTDAPLALEREIDAGNMEGMVTFYRLKNGHLGMLNGGFTLEGLFSIVCELRRVMVATMPVEDEDAAGELALAQAELRRWNLAYPNVKPNKHPATCECPECWQAMEAGGGSAKG